MPWQMMSPDHRHHAIRPLALARPIVGDTSWYSRKKVRPNAASPSSETMHRNAPLPDSPFDEGEHSRPVIVEAIGWCEREAGEVESGEQAVHRGCPPARRAPDRVVDAGHRPVRAGFGVRSARSASSRFADRTQMTSATVPSCASSRQAGGPARICPFHRGDDIPVGCRPCRRRSLDHPRHQPPMACSARANARWSGSRLCTLTPSWPRLTEPILYECPSRVHHVHRNSSMPMLAAAA